MFIGVSLGGRKLNEREESELGKDRKLKEKGILMLGGYGLGRVNEFWHGGEQRNVCADVFVLLNDTSSSSVGRSARIYY